MAGSRSDLFKWKRQTKPSSFHSGSNIKTWIKNVQRASDEAAQEVFGEGYHGVLDQVYADDDALSEAQDLLNSWVKEKTLKTIEPELEFFDEKWASHPVSQPSSKASKQHHLSASDSGHAFGLGVFNDSYTDTTLQSPKLGNDYDEELNEEIAVQEVVRNMLDKKVVKDDLLSDLGFDSKKNRIDPRTKMELRHKQVREKSENRRRDLERERREKAAQKEAQHLARQQLLQEEKERQAKAKKEEMMMHKEMAKIRKAMEEEQRMKKEQKEREQFLTAEARAMAQEQMKQEQKRKEKKKREEKEATEEMRRLLLKQMEEKAAEDARNDLRLFQKYFSSWYSVVVDQRIKLGKARALADWKIKLRAWNAWRAYIWHIKSDKEAQAVAMEMKEKHRKELLATQFYHRHLLHRCLGAWQIFVHHSKQEQELMKQQEEKANKMAALLEAAASGRLWNQRECKMNENDEVNERNAQLSVEDVEDEEMSLPSTARQVDEMFSQGPRKVNTRIMTSARSSINEEEPVPGKPLTNAWGKPPPNNRDKNTRYGHKFTDHRNDVQRLPRAKQRTLSHTDKVEDLRSKLKERQSKNNENKKPLAKSRSVEMLVEKKPNTPQGRGGGSVSDLQVEDIDGKEQVEVWSDLGTDRSDGSSKLLSREPKIKSDKPTTKPILLAMEERAKLRAQRKAAIDDRKRKLEEEKLAKLRLEQERKELEFMKEKQEMMKKKKEEKRLAQEMELEKKRRQEHLRKLNCLATEHYSKTLLIKYGLSPWKQLVAMAHQNMSSAVEHHGQALVITCFYPWLQYTRQNKAQKKEAADQLYRKIILRRSWRSWRKYGQHMVRLEAVAEDYCVSYLLKKYYHIWQDYVTNEQIALWQKEQQADEHNQWRLQKVAFAYWKKLIPMVKAEQEREKRRKEMRKRVQAWLPDFQSSPLDSSP